MQSSPARPSESPDIRVRLRGVGKHYASTAHPMRLLLDLLWGRQSKAEHFVALDDVNLDIPGGQTLGLIGRNGSGKSTLLQILCGTLSPSTGQVQVQGRIAALLELGSGFNPEFTGRENVFLNGSLLGMSQRELDLAFDSICEFAEIGHYIDQPVKTYSSGMFVRLAFAVVIHTQPDVLVVDEALAVGDARFQAKCLKAIGQLKERGVTIVLVTHDVSVVRQICDAAVWLRDGAVAMQGDVGQVTSAYMQYLFADAVAPPTPMPLESAAPSCDPDSEPARRLQLHYHQDLQHIPASAWLSTQPPLSRWGSAPELILGCVVQNELGQPTACWTDDGPITVSIRFRMPSSGLTSSLSVAIAVKDLRGQDLLILSTHDQGMRLSLPADQADSVVSFTFANPLREGQYVLIAAIEDRQGDRPHYFDFIEGIEFFEVIRSKPTMGLFVLHPAIELSSLAPLPQ